MRTSGWQFFSANMHATIEAVLHKLGLRQCFEVLVGGDDVACRKPHPEGLCKILSYWQVAPVSAVYVADGANEAATGASADIRTLLI